MKEYKLFNVFGFIIIIGIVLFVLMVIIDFILELDRGSKIILIMGSIGFGCIVVGLFGVIIMEFKKINKLQKEMK